MEADIQTDIVDAVEEDLEVIFDTKSSLRNSRLALKVTAGELQEFCRVLKLRPFNAGVAHRIVLNQLMGGPPYFCGLRMSHEGRRKDLRIPVCGTTYGGLQYVFNQFSPDAEMASERHSSIRLLL